MFVCDPAAGELDRALNELTNVVLAGKTFDTWDEAVSSIPAPTQRSLTTLEWIDRHENLVVCGPSGTGKSHLLEALGHAAIGHGCHVQWFSLETLAR